MIGKLSLFLFIPFFIPVINTHNGQRSINIAKPYINNTTDTITIARVTVNIETSYVPTPTAIPIVTPTAQVKGTTETERIMSAINDYRRSHGLTIVQTDPYTCGFAQVRAAEIVNNFNHDGFTNRINSKTLPYPSYQEVTENLAKTSDDKNVVNLWINSPGHAANMRKDTPYICVAKNSDYYAYVGWRP